MNNASIAIMIFSAQCALLTSCSTKPFQPPPPTFLQLIKPGCNPEETKREMIDCGEQNVYTGRNNDDTVQDIVKRQNCMFNKGYRYSSGWRGLCAEKAVAALPECLDWPWQRAK
jgi:hypothetical protein